MKNITIKTILMLIINNFILQQISYNSFNFPNNSYHTMTYFDMKIVWVPNIAELYNRS